MPGSGLTGTQRDALRAALGDEVRWDEPMALHTTFRIGGPCDAFLSAGSAEACIRAVRVCAEMDIPLHVMGNGSNLLVRDGGIRGLVLQIYEGMNGVEVAPPGVHAQAGALLSAVCARALKAEPARVGLEFASGIPGTLGGALIMNAGAYGGEMAQFVERVEVLGRDGEVRSLERGELSFGYRDSSIARERLIVLSAVLRVDEGDAEAARGRTEEYTRRRREKQPLSMPSAGSVFKRPQGMYAGDLIQRSGLKGLRVGGAKVSEMHANFIVNDGGATAADVLALIEEIRVKVFEGFGVWLEPELHAVGEDG